MTIAIKHNHPTNDWCPEVFYEGEVRGACTLPSLRDIDFGDVEQSDVEAVSHMESAEAAMQHWHQVWDEAMTASRQVAQLPKRREYHARHAAQPRGLAWLTTVILGNVALTAAAGVLAGLSVAAVLALVLKAIQS